MTFDQFVTLFPAADVLGGQYGLDLTDDEAVRFYVNESGQVGEARENRRTTTCAYSLLYGEDADMVISYYRK